MSITKNTHYNPCFWTALWNYDYYVAFKNDNHNKLKARNQVIYSLNLKSEKIIKTNIDNTFYEKYTGIADLSVDNMLKYCKKRFPEEYNELKDKIENTEDLRIDFENYFSLFENDFGYKTLLGLNKKGKIDSLREKTYISLFVFVHFFRNPIHLNPLFRFFEQMDYEKFEVFHFFKYAIFSDPKELMKAIMPILSKKWTIFKSRRYLPLGDNPILQDNSSFFIILSPYLILRISDKNVPKEYLCTYSKVSYFLHRKVRRLTIQNSFREIISHDRKILERMLKSKIFSEHQQRLKTKKHPYYNFENYYNA